MVVFRLVQKRAHYQIACSIRFYDISEYNKHKRKSQVFDENASCFSLSFHLIRPHMPIISCHVYFHMYLRVFFERVLFIVVFKCS